LFFEILGLPLETIKLDSFNPDKDVLVVNIDGINIYFFLFENKQKE